MAKKKTNKYGKWAFIVGVLLAVLTGFLMNEVPVGIVGLVLVGLGLVVGFMNVQEKEATNFLLAAIGLMAVNPLVLERITLFGLGPYLSAMFTNIVFFVAPAAVVVALKLVFDLAKD